MRRVRKAILILVCFSSNTTYLAVMRPSTAIPLCNPQTIPYLLALHLTKLPNLPTTWLALEIMFCSPVLIIPTLPFNPSFKLLRLLISSFPSFLVPSTPFLILTDPFPYLAKNLSYTHTYPTRIPVPYSYLSYPYLATITFDFGHFVIVIGATRQGRGEEETNPASTGQY